MGTGKGNQGGRHRAASPGTTTRVTKPLLKTGADSVPGDLLALVSSSLLVHQAENSTFDLSCCLSQKFLSLPSTRPWSILTSSWRLFNYTRHP